MIDQRRADAAPPLTFALAGAGVVGTAVAERLRASGAEATGVWSRTPAHADLAAARLDAPLFALQAPPRCDLMIIATTDAAIAPVAEVVAPQLGEATLLIHFAGVFGTGVLAAHRGPRAALHPVQSCPSLEAASEMLPGSAWAVTCAPETRERAHELVARLGGIPVDVAEADRPAWHAACSLVAGAIAGSLDLAATILAAIGVADPFAVIGPLAGGVVHIARDAKEAAATGPVARGDVATLTRHRHALALAVPELIEAHASMTLGVIAAARAQGRIDEPAAGRLRAVVEPVTP